jgi:hypothetical protein
MAVTLSDMLQVAQKLRFVVTGMGKIVQAFCAWSSRGNIVCIRHRDSKYSGSLVQINEVLTLEVERLLKNRWRGALDLGTPGFLYT